MDSEEIIKTMPKKEIEKVEDKKLPKNKKTVEPIVEDTKAKKVAKVEPTADKATQAVNKTATADGDARALSNKTAPVVTTELVDISAAVNKEVAQPAEVSSGFAEEIPHQITEEDLKNNPELVGEVEVGEIIGIPVDEIVSKETPIFPITGALLSDQAIKWKKYLELQKITPEKFLEKYINHPSRKFVEELIINR